MPQSAYSPPPTQYRVKEYRFLSIILNGVGLATSLVTAAYVWRAAPMMAYIILGLCVVIIPYRMVMLAQSLKQPYVKQLAYYKLGAYAAAAVSVPTGLLMWHFYPALGEAYAAALICGALVNAATITTASAPLTRFSGLIGSVAILPLAARLFQGGQWVSGALLLIGSLSFVLLGNFIGQLFANQEERRYELDRLRMRTEDAMRWFLREASDWAFETNSKLSFVFLSENFDRIARRDPDTLIGRSLFDIVKDFATDYEGNADGLSDMHRALDNVDDFENVVIEIYNGAGNPRMTSFSGRPIISKEGAFLGYRGWATDITVQFNATVRLEEEVRERTFALEQQTKKALAAAQAKSDFLANMSHEIRTPLNGVLGCADTLRHGLKDPDMKELAETVHLSGEILLRTLNDILEMSRLSSGSVSIQRAPFDPEALIDQVATMHIATARQKGIRIIGDATALGPYFYEGDQVRLSQVIGNFLSNAVKFASKGTVWISASQQGGRVRFSVTDEGPGLTEEDQSRCFEEFVQTASSTGKGGTGLGLSICRKLAELMGGAVGVESRLGRGATFYCDLPLPRADRKPVPSALPQPIVILCKDKPLAQVVADWLEEDSRQVVVATDWAHVPPSAVAGTPPVVLALGLPCPPPGALPERTIRIPFALAGATGAGHELPLTRNTLRRAMIGALAEASNAAARDARSPERYDIAILVVDDNPINRMVAKTMLDPMAREVTTAESGDAALALLSLQSFDLILMDFSMPGLSGPQTTREILSRDPGQLVVGLTAHADAESQADGLDAGMRRVMTKPLRRDKLIETIEAYVRPSAPERQANGTGF